MAANLHLHLDETEREFLRRIAEARGLSKSSTIRVLIRLSMEEVFGEEASKAAKARREGSCTEAAAEVGRPT